MFAIAGVSGNTGKVVADTLLAAGKPVRVIVRSAAKGEPWRSKGAEVAIADLADASTLTRALRGATGAYLISPQDPRSDDPISTGWRIAHAMGTAVEASAVSHVVLLSSIGAEHAEGTGIIRTLHAAEERLSQTAAKVTYLRAAYLLENWLGVLGAAAGGKLPTFISPDHVMPMVCTRDVGMAAARLLIEGPSAAKRDVVELSGPRDLSPRDVAAVLARLLEKPVDAEHAPVAAVVSVFTSFGMSPAMAEQCSLLFQGIADGKIAPQGNGARQLRGSVQPETLFAAALDQKGG